MCKNEKRIAGIRDVARKAQVGVGTVSRYLNESGYVSKESREKIEKAISELDYQPNELARNLYHNRSGIIGLIVPDLEYPLFSKLSKYIEISLYEKNYKTMICNTVGVSNREKEYLSLLERNEVDGSSSHRTLCTAKSISASTVRSSPWTKTSKDRSR